VGSLCFYCWILYGFVRFIGRSIAKKDIPPVFISEIKRLERSTRRLMHHRYQPIRYIEWFSRFGSRLNFSNVAELRIAFSMLDYCIEGVNYIYAIKLQLERALGSLFLFVFLHAVNEIRANRKFLDLINAHRRYVIVAFGSWSDSFESARACGKYQNSEYTHIHAHAHRPSCIPFPRHALSSGVANSVYQLTWMRLVLLI
jgi:hypothetical protein